MTDQPTTAPSRLQRRSAVEVLLWLLVAAVVAIGCTGSDDGDDEGAPTDDPTSDASADASSDGAEAGRPVGDCETSVTAPEIEYRDTAELTDQERQLLDVFRARSASILVEQNPMSCRALVETSALVEAEDFGAFEVKSFSHADPEIRYDLFYFTERQPVDTTIPEVISTRLSATVEPGSTLQVWTVAETLYLAVTTPAGDTDAEAIVAHYDQLIAGEE